MLQHSIMTEIDMQVVSRQELFTVCQNRRPAHTTPQPPLRVLDDLPIEEAGIYPQSHTLSRPLIGQLRPVYMSVGGSPALTARHTDAEDGPSAAHAHIDFSKSPTCRPRSIHAQKKWPKSTPALVRPLGWDGFESFTRSSICDMSTLYSYSEGYRAICRCRFCLSSWSCTTEERICSLEGLFKIA